MNEAETRAEYIDPKLKQAGWGEVEGSKILREFRITEGRIQAGGVRTKPEIADYVLVYNNQKVAVIEAKKDELEATEGVEQAKAYAEKLHIQYTYSTNGKEIYQICMKTGSEGIVDEFPSPEELISQINAKSSEWKQKFDEVPYEDMSGTKKPRYYQEIAVDKTLDAIEVSKVSEIPVDYKGVMGVPITFFDKYNPKQFEILGITDRDPKSKYRTKFYSRDDSPKYNDLNRRAAIKVNNSLVPTYARLLIIGWQTVLFF